MQVVKGQDFQKRKEAQRKIFDLKIIKTVMLAHFMPFVNTLRCILTIKSEHNYRGGWSKIVSRIFPVFFL